MGIISAHAQYTLSPKTHYLGRHIFDISSIRSPSYKQYLFKAHAILKSEITDIGCIFNLLIFILINASVLAIQNHDCAPGAFKIIICTGVGCANRYDRCSWDMLK